MDTSVPYAVEVEGLAKRYRLGQVQRTGLDLLRRRPRDWVDALDDVSFTVERGEIVGIVGRNGAGKSTLLKIVSRITQPTAGRILLRGRVGSLLEVGTGFHPELTGRENVGLNGSILGMRRREIAAKFDDIVEFSGVAAFLDTPLKFYSTGMAVRLGFAVAAFLEPEILVVDEVLAVGDIGFQERCLGKMREIAGGGRTVLFVSHNMAAVSALCTRTVWLDGGRVGFDGPSAEGVRRYVEASRVGRETLTSGERRGTGTARIVGVRLESEDGEPIETVPSGRTLRLCLDYDAPAPLQDVAVNVTLGDGTRGLCSFMSEVAGAPFAELPATGTLVCTVPALALAPGVYELTLSLLVRREVVDKVPQAGSLVVGEGDFFGTGVQVPNVGYYGPLLVRNSWTVEARSPAAAPRAEERIAP
jgi:lipopolysaccharide transport system ATP-binding protein